jgi:hypothetical protein
MHYLWQFSNSVDVDMDQCLTTDYTKTNQLEGKRHCHRIYRRNLERPESHTTKEGQPGQERGEAVAERRVGGPSCRSILLE